MIKEAGYDGEYGVIRLMRPEELTPSASLFDLPATSQFDSPAMVPEPAGAGAPAAGATGIPPGTHARGERRGDRGGHPRHQHPIH